jgi:hypothetical protein
MHPRWMRGKIDDYNYEAQVFDEGSKYGINEGTVSKLCVVKGEEYIANYDRGWDIEPITDEHKDITQQIIDYLEQSGTHLKF